MLPFFMVRIALDSMPSVDFEIVMDVISPSIVTSPCPEIPLPEDELMVKVPPVMLMVPVLCMAWSVEFMVKVPPVMVRLSPAFSAFMLVSSALSVSVPPSWKSPNEGLVPPFGIVPPL
jgi:hypothetical protein